MSERSFERWEAQVRATAQAFPYPPTPDIAAAVRQRLSARPARRRPRTWRLAWAAAIALVLLAGLLSVPQVRAAVLDALRLGAIRIFPATPTPAAMPTASVPVGIQQPNQLPPEDLQAAATSTARGETQPTVVALPSPTPLRSILQLAGETTLAEARAKAGFPILLPTHPPGLGPPDQVYLQDLGGPAVILLWLDSDRPGRVRLSLHELGPGTFAQKVAPTVVAETTVNRQRALWTEGPYLLQYQNGDYEVRRLVEGHVLIWVQGEITYRLESDLSLEEAVQIAESLRVMEDGQ